MCDAKLVHDATMAEALKSVLYYFDVSKERQGTSQVSGTLIQGIIDFLSDELDAGGCDHSVNICACGDAAVVEELQRVMAGEVQCPDCGGEGYNYDQAQFEKRRAELLAQWGGEQWYDIPDDEGFVPCAHCDKTGVVKVAPL